MEKASTEAQLRVFPLKAAKAATVGLNSSRSQPKQFSVHSRAGRVIEDVKVNMLQGIMQSESESESDDDDEENNEDEAKKPTTSDKPKRSSRDKEMMMIMKHVNFTVQRDREVPRQGRSEQGERWRKHQQYDAKHFTEERYSQSRSFQEPMQLSSRGKHLVWPSGGNNYREHRFNRSCYRQRGSRGREHQLGVETFQFEISTLPKDIANSCRRKSTHGT